MLPNSIRATHKFSQLHSPSSLAPSFDKLLPAHTLEIELVNPKRPSQHRTVQLVLTDNAVLLNECELSPPRATCSSVCLPFTDADEPEVCFSYLNILNCSLARPQPSATLSFELAALTSTHPSRGRTVALKGFLSNPIDADEAARWVECVMSRAYEAQGVPRNRRLLVIVNPYGGSGLGQKIWSNTASPILTASTATLDLHFTTHSGHAAEIGEKMDIDRFDVVVCVSGDGVVHELINGLARRPDAGRALRKLALASIPAGSGNALSANHMGPQDCLNTVLAALTAVKGTAVPLDLCSVTQSLEGGSIERRVSFLSTAFGLMADLDVGTERWRWMGGTRFVLGYLWGAIANRRQRVRLDMQVLEADKSRMEARWQTQRAQPNMCGGASDEPREGLPALRFGDVQKPIVDGQDGWTTIDDSITSIYAGTLPFMAADLLEFPVKIPGDDSIDVIVHRSPSTFRTLKCIDGADQGSMFRNDDVRYFKTKAFRLTPLDKSGSPVKPANEKHDPKRDPEKGPSRVETSGPVRESGQSYIVVDGEEMPYKAVQVEVHNGLGKVLSLGGRRLGKCGVPRKFLD